MKYLMVVILCLTATIAVADKRKELMQEYEQNQQQMHQCVVALAKAIRNNNVWDEDDLTVAECKARAYEAIDIGQRMLNLGISTADE